MRATTRIFMITIILLLVLSPVAAQSSQARAQYVLVISIDGARPDGLRAAGIGPLLDEASYSMSAQTTVPPSTAPSHMSMVSGVGPDKHGVRDNNWRPGHPYPAVPTMFSVAKRAGLRTAIFTQKVYVPVVADPQYMDRVELVPWRPATLTSDLVSAASAYIRAARPHVMLAHISEPDAAGHAEGWMAFLYLQALRRSIAGIGTLRQALRDAGIAEQTLVIVTADHDLRYGSHGPARAGSDRAAGLGRQARGRGVRGGPGDPDGQPTVGRWYSGNEGGSARVVK